MSTPVPTTSALYPVRLREDLARDVAYAYWAGPHAEIVKRLPHVIEYNQYHFLGDRPRILACHPHGRHHRPVVLATRWAHRGADVEYGRRSADTAAHARGVPRRTKRLRTRVGSPDRTPRRALVDNRSSTTPSVTARYC